MSNLIGLLTSQQTAFYKALDDSLIHCVDNPKLSFLQFIKIKSQLLAHWQLEDNELYPVLFQEAEVNHVLSATLEIFAKDMNTVTKSVFDFYDKYSSTNTWDEFDFDLQRVVGKLKMRMRNEEKNLFRAYDAAMNSQVRAIA
jgi:hypothetical protein